MTGRLSSRHTLIPLSGFEKSLIMTGVIFKVYSSSDNLAPIFITDAKTFGPPPPNSTDLRSSGKTLALKNSSGKSSDTSSSSLNNNQCNFAPSIEHAYLKNSSLSASLLSPRLSIPSDILISGVSKNPPLRRP